ncbi:division/cell wall cluster transcriptional repressor MraZ [Shewanella sp. NIFS-20-20]|uniref:division/cell wall cluster transcriptional repressor MraZ n=1 Tax=Shewanella sp. NIFS-20-20 TaxID=2853806 RepID=UPI001C47B2AE|nr:division/cell wall cluster transcriptional repressor MraZ [Shewanella sp. NIFS-20-20]MBV7315748.1 division/cell wall cluster transcriptional repressor MraZ [Shewanella sp. NIFS-20-20]
MFRGASLLNLDAKGRIAMPVRYREALCRENTDDHRGKLVVTVDINSPCLLIYPLDEWQKVEDKLLTLSDTQPAERALKRLLLGHAHEIELDANSRLLIPPVLRQYAHFDKQLTLVGQLNKFELWDQAQWQQQVQMDQQVILNEPLADNVRLADFSL